MMKINVEMLNHLNSLKPLYTDEEFKEILRDTLELSYLDLGLSFKEVIYNKHKYLDELYKTFL